MLDKDISMVDVEKQLGLKDVEFGMKRKNKQLKYLGFIVPDYKLLKSFKEYEDKGWTAGIIKAREKRESKYGPYVVYRLSPNGSFWSREVQDLQKGQAIAVLISGKNGKAKQIKIL